jgi:hypothetical protein
LNEAFFLAIIAAIVTVMAAEKLGENSAVEAVLKHNNELKLIYNYDNYIGFVKSNEKAINYVYHCVNKKSKV